MPLDASVVGGIGGRLHRRRCAFSARGHRHRVQDPRSALRVEPPEPKSSESRRRGDRPGTERAWPEPRAFWGQRLADVLTAADRAGARRIGMDMMFAGRVDDYLEQQGIGRATSWPNATLAKAIHGSRATVLLATKENGMDWAQPDFYVREFQWASASTPYRDLDTIRRLDCRDGGLPALAFACADQPQGLGRRYWINYDRAPLRVIPAIDFLANQTEGDRTSIKGAVVLIGETWDRNSDLQSTPFGPRFGVEVQAEAVRTLLARSEPTVLSRRLVAVICAVAAGLFGLAAMAWAWWRYAASIVVAGALYTSGAFLALSWQHWLLPLAAPILAVFVVVPLIAYPVREVQRRLDLERSEADRARIRSRWGQMIDDRLVEYIEGRRDAGLGPLGTVDCSFLYLDVADFSAISNRVSPDRMLGDVNRMFEALVPLIQAEQGIVISFTGDGLSSAFDPVEGAADHRRRALGTAQRLLAKIDELNAKDAFEGGDWRIRIGLGNGPVTLALVGDERRQTMAFYGEAVNLTSRLEQAGKEIGASLVMSEAYGDVARELGIAVEARAIRLKGWKDEINVWVLAHRRM